MLTDDIKALGAALEKLEADYTAGTVSALGSDLVDVATELEAVVADLLPTPPTPPADKKFADMPEAINWQRVVCVLYTAYNVFAGLKGLPPLTPPAYCSVPTPAPTPVPTP